MRELGKEGSNMRDRERDRLEKKMKHVHKDELSRNKSEKKEGTTIKNSTYQVAPISIYSYYAI